MIYIYYNVARAFRPKNMEFHTYPYAYIHTYTYVYTHTHACTKLHSKCASGRNEKKHTHERIHINMDMYMYGRTVTWKCAPVSKDAVKSNVHFSRSYSRIHLCILFICVPCMYVFAHVCTHLPRILTEIPTIVDPVALG